MSKRKRGSDPTTERWRMQVKTALQTFLKACKLTKKEFADILGLTEYQVKAVIDARSILAEGARPYLVIYYHTGLEAFNPLNYPTRRVNRGETEDMMLTLEEYWEFCDEQDPPYFLEDVPDPQELEQIANGIGQELAVQSRAAIKLITEALQRLNEDGKVGDRDVYQTLTQTELIGLYRLLLPYTKGKTEREQLIQMNSLL